MPDRIWWRARMAALDLESTHAEPETARVVQAALIRCGGDEPTETWTTLVDPLIDIPAEATKIHGISTAQAQAEGVQPDAFLHTVIAFFDAAIRDGVPVVVFNASYDLTVVLAECARHDVVPPQLPHIIDPFIMDGHVSRRKGKRTLSACCDFWGVKIERAHEAAADAIAAARVAYVIGRKFPTVGGATLDEMQAKQATWAAERAASYRKYAEEELAHAQARMARINRSDGSWPMRAAAPASERAA